MSSISLITAVFNSSETLLHSLKSVDEQTVAAEHILIDGNSKDDSLKLAKSYSGHPLMICSEPDNGIYDALNKGIARVQGDIIGILNSDDFYSTNNVLDLVLEIFRDETFDVCYGDLCYVDRTYPLKTRRYWKAGNYSSTSFYWGWMPPHPTFFVRRRVYEEYGVFNLNLGSAADYELMLRFMLKYGVRAKYIPEVLVKMRVGGVSSRSIKKQTLGK